jgi:RNA polymerase sigma-70 factor (family 1)
MSDNPTKHFQELFDVNRDKVFRFALKLTGDASRADEITQQCFIRLWENMEQVKPGQDIFPLLFVYAKNLVIDESRKLYRSRKAMQEIPPSGHDAPVDTPLLEKEYQSHLQKVIEKMPEQRKAVYLLSRDKGCTNREIAVQLAISPATVKNHLTLALQFIKREVMLHYGMEPK